MFNKQFTLSYISTNIDGSSAVCVVGTDSHVGASLGRESHDRRQSRYENKAKHDVDDDDSICIWYRALCSWQG